MDSSFVMGKGSARVSGLQIEAITLRRDVGAKSYLALHLQRDFFNALVNFVSLWLIIAFLRHVTI